MPDEKETAVLAVQFLARVQLTGQEVPAFNHVISWLESFAKAAPGE